MRQHKYNAKKYKLRIDGVEHTFDSKLEGDRYLMLLSMERDGKISDLETQPEFVIQDKFRRNGKGFRAIKYRADFMYRINGDIVVEDAKGMKLPEYKIKMKMFLQQFPEIKFCEIERKGRGFAITEY